MLVKLIGFVFKLGPLIFGLGFMAPLIAQLITLAQLSLPFQLGAHQAGLILGGGFGLLAQFRGSWIWLK